MGDSGDLEGLSIPFQLESSLSALCIYNVDEVVNIDYDQSSPKEKEILHLRTHIYCTRYLQKQIDYDSSTSVPKTHGVHIEQTAQRSSGLNEILREVHFKLISSYRSKAKLSVHIFKMHKP